MHGERERHWDWSEDDDHVSAYPYEPYWVEGLGWVTIAIFFALIIGVLVYVPERQRSDDRRDMHELGHDV